MTKKILIIAGEVSGDLHGAELIKRTKKLNPQLHFFGIGGHHMASAGADIIIDNKSLAVVGIFEVLTHYQIIKSAYKKIKNILIHEPPDLLILVDYPGFNLRMAKIAKKQGIKVLYFISPQLWAWKQGRIKTIKACVDTMAVILPFEVNFYKQHQVKAYYVGNPIIEQIKPSMSKAEALVHFNLNPDNPIIGILPGSRNKEVHYNFNTLLDAAALIKKKYPKAQFVLPIADTLDREQIQQYISAKKLDIKIIAKELYNLLQCCDAAMVVSGTVTLETALMGIPFLILYKLSYISFYIGRLIVHVDTIGLCNIVAEKKLIKEFIQYQATPQALSEEIIDLMTNQSRRKQLIDELIKIKSRFLQDKQYDIAKLVLSCLKV